MFELPLIKTLSLGPLHLQVWGMLVGLGMLTGYLWARVRFKQRGLSLDHLDTIVLILIGAGLVGARLLWVLIEFPASVEHPLDAFKIWDGGMAFTGGFLAALGGLWMFIKKHHLKFWVVADALALPLVAGLFIGRFGCWLTGLHPGIPVTFGPVYSLDTTRLAWPAYAILNWGIALVILSQFEKRLLKKSWLNGTLSHVVLLWWALWRFASDFLRSDNPLIGGDARIAGLTPTQYLALLVIVFTVISFLSLKRRQSRA